MKTPHDHGEQEAMHAAGTEAPTCWICDRPITDLDSISYTTRGKPLCPTCHEEINDRAAAHAKGVPAALEEILRPGRTK